MSSTIPSLDIASERRQRAEAIIAQLKTGLASALAPFPVEMVYLHGSVARGHPLPDSDIDLAVVFQEPLLPAYERLKLELNIEQKIVPDNCRLFAKVG